MNPVWSALAEQGVKAKSERRVALSIAGIGHSVATTIVEAHGGALREERSGLDASAHIRLPLSLEAAP